MSLLCLLLAVLLAWPATAQKIIKRQEKLGAGQRVFLNLKPGEHIRVRPGRIGEMSFKATVNINQNQLNEAFLLDISRTADELTVKADLDEEALRTAPPGDCPDGQGSYSGGGWRRVEGKYQLERGVCISVDYDVTVPAGTELRVSTWTGNINIVGLHGPIKAETFSGDVDLSWPRAQPAGLALKTVTGEVYADPGVTFANRRDNPVISYEMRGTWKASGGPAVKLETISGNVFFRQAK